MLQQAINSIQSNLLLSVPLTVLGLLLAIASVVVLLRAIYRDRSPSYVRTARLLSENELDFVRQLRAICPKDWIVCPQVAISALVEVAAHVRDRRAARNCYSQRYADFVLCCSDTYDIVGIIELDDRSHHQAHRRARDERLDTIYQSIGLPIAHVPARKTGRYTTKDAEVALEAIRRQRRSVSTKL